jgi:hypothetical protein
VGLQLVVIRTVLISAGARRSIFWAAGWSAETSSVAVQPRMAQRLRAYLTSRLIVPTTRSMVSSDVVCADCRFGVKGEVC